MFGPDEEVPPGLEPRMVAYYRKMYLIHADDRTTGLCWVCKRSKCEDYRFASASLITAGQRLPDLL